MTGNGIEIQASSNRLLASLPPGEYRRIGALLQPVVLPEDRMVVVPGRAEQVIYFPSSGVCSVTRATRAGRVIEVATVGADGFVGVDVLLGDGLPEYGATMRVRDDAAVAMPVDIVRREMEARTMFAGALGDYARHFMLSLMQLVACNALHSVEQRCARWLMSMCYAVGADEFPFTQSSLAAALGVRRPTVTLAIRSFHDKGLVMDGRRRLAVLDRERLSSVACECAEVLCRWRTTLDAEVKVPLSSLPPIEAHQPHP